MNATERRARINELEKTIPILQAELEGILAEFQKDCAHPYGIGWKYTTVGFVATNGHIGCPQCGLIVDVFGWHTPILVPPFDTKPIYWISSGEWEFIFKNTSLATIANRTEALDLDKPPTTP